MKNCERCAKPNAINRQITVLLDYGWSYGTAREEVTFTLCERCYTLAIQAQPVIPEQFLDYEPTDTTPAESHDYAYADYEREIAQHGEWY